MDPRPSGRPTASASSATSPRRCCTAAWTSTPSARSPRGAPTASRPRSWRGPSSRTSASRNASGRASAAARSGKR
eukprot:31089-Pelagococcus_subviridis.AAC.17